MKQAVLLLLLSCSLMVSAQQSPISGVVSIHNSQFKTGTRQYVQNAQVEDDLSETKAQPTTTDATGTFKIVYVGVGKGKSVVLSIKKAGLQVVNTPDLTAVAGQTDALKISMAHPDSIAEYRKRLYNIGKSEAEKNLYAQLKKKGAAIEALQKDAQKNAAAIEKLQHEYAELDKYAKNIEEQAQDLARRYAPINLDDAAPLYREAFGYFQQGDLEKAMQILRGADLIGQADKILAERKAIGTIRQEANQRDSLQQQRTKDLLQVLGLKADLHQSKFEWDSVQFCLELRVNLDSTNVNNLWALARFFQDQNEIQKAIIFYKKSLSVTKLEGLVGNFCNNLGNAYSALNQMPEAEKYYFKSLEIYERLSKSNPQQFEQDLSGTVMNLGNFYKSLNQMPEAEKYYLKSFEISERLSKNNSVQFEPYLARISLNIGNFYYTLNRMPEAEKYYLKSFNIYELFSKSNSQQFEPYLAGTAVNLGTFYMNLNQMPEAEKYYLKSLEIYERLSKNNYKQFEDNLAKTFECLGIFYQPLNQIPEAEKYYLKSLDIRERLAKDNPQQFEPDLARMLANLGNFYIITQKVSEAEKYHLKSLEIRERLTKSNPQQFEPDLATTLMNLGIFYSDLARVNEAEKHFLKSLNIYERLSKSNLQQFEPSLGLLLYNFGWFYKEQKDYTKTETYLTSALVIYEKWEKVSPSVFSPNRKTMWRVVKEFYEEWIAASTATEKTALEKKLKDVLARE